MSTKPARGTMIAVEAVEAVPAAAEISAEAVVANFNSVERRSWKQGRLHFVTSGFLWDGRGSGALLAEGIGHCAYRGSYGEGTSGG